MTWTEYRAILVRWGWLVVVSAVMGAAGAWLITQNLTPEYRARAQVSMVPAEMDWRMRDFTKELARNVTIAFPSPELVLAVRDATAMEMGPAALARALGASFNDGTLIITVEAFHATPDAARRLAIAAVQAFHAEYMAYFEARDFASFVEFTILTPEPEVIRTAPNTLTNTLMGLILGLAAGIGLALLLLWRDEEWLIQPATVTRAVELPTLGALPLDGRSD